MKCNRCGCPLDDDSVFCTNCGARVDSEIAPTANAEQKKKNGKKLAIVIISAVATLLALVGGIILLTIKNNTVNIEDYLKVDISYSGYDSVGEASIDYDFDKSILDEITTSKIKKDVEGSVVLLWLYGCVDVDLDKNEGLSNGDKITATFKVNYDDINDFNFKKKIKGPDVITKEYTVSGLDEAAIFNPLDAIGNIVVEKFGTGVAAYIIPANDNVSFKGSYVEYYGEDSNNITMTATVKDINGKRHVATFDVDITFSDDYKTASVSFSEGDLSRLEDYGIVITKTFGDIDINNKYPNSSDDFNSDAYDELLTKATDHANSLSVSDVRFEKAYIAISDYGDDYYNRMICYGFTGKNSEGKDIFFIVFIEGVQVSENGDVVSIGEIRDVFDDEYSDIDSFYEYISEEEESVQEFVKK